MTVGCEEGPQFYLKECREKEIHLAVAEFAEINCKEEWNIPVERIEYKFQDGMRSECTFFKGYYIRFDNNNWV